MSARPARLYAQAITVSALKASARYGWCLFPPMLLIAEFYTARVAGFRDLPSRVLDPGSVRVLFYEDCVALLRFNDPVDAAQLAIDMPLLGPGHGIVRPTGSLGPFGERGAGRYWITGGIQSFRAVRLYIWPLWLIAVVCALRWIARFRSEFARFWASAETRCRVCGYDLRATPERCPECGTEVA